MDAQKLLKKRDVWMAVAMLWVLYYHLDLRFTFPPLHALKLFGYGGVDMFLFASGIGCWYSLKRDNRLLPFLKRRFLRIMPTYWLFLPFWFVMRFWLYEPLDVPAFIGNILCIQDFTDKSGGFNWYMSAIWLMYFLAPLLFELLKGCSRKRDCLLILAVLVLSSIPFWEQEKLIITFTRTPVFFVGMAFAKVIDGQQLDRRFFTLCFGWMAAGCMLLAYFFLFVTNHMRPWGLWWYPFILMTPGICVGISLVSDWLDHWNAGRVLNRMLISFGKCSFCVFLVHIVIYDVTRYLIKAETIPNSGVVWLAAVACSVALSYFLQAAVNRLPWVKH